MKTMKRIAALLLGMLMLCGVLAGCGQEPPADPETADLTVQVSILDAEGVALLDVSVGMAEGSSAKEAIFAACQGADAVYNFNDGMFDGFFGLESTQTDGWLLYVNDAQAEVGAADIVLQEGDSLSFRYENYSEAFGL